MPEHGRQVWALFWRLSAHRVERNRISPAVMAEWLRLNCQQIDSHEARIIEAMDRQFLETLAEEIALNEERRKGAKKPSR